MNSKWQRAGQQVKPGLKIVGKLALLTALRYGPAGVAGWVNLCLTAAGYALQQKSFLMRLCNSTADSLNSLTLLVCQMQTFLQLRPVGIAVAQNTLLTTFAPAFLT